MKELKSRQIKGDCGPGSLDGATLLDLARGWLRQGNHIVASELLETAILSPAAGHDRLLRARILKELGRVKMIESSWEESEAHYLGAQRIFMESGDYQGAAECARNRANAYFQHGHYAEAKRLCVQALEWASVANDYELRASILNTQAALSAQCGDLHEAIRIFKLCQADFQCAGNVIRQGYVLLNIGLTQTELGEYRPAVESLNQSLAIALDEKDLNLVEICYQNIAKCYLAQEEYSLAKSVIDTARRILPGLDSKALEAELNLVDGRVARLMGQLSNAHELLEKSSDLADAYDLKGVKADVLIEQGKLAGDAAHHDLMLSKLRAAADLYSQLGQKKGHDEAIRLIEQSGRGESA